MIVVGIDRSSWSWFPGFSVAPLTNSTMFLDSQLRFALIFVDEGSGWFVVFSDHLPFQNPKRLQEIYATLVTFTG